MPAWSLWLRDDCSVMGASLSAIFEQTFRVGSTGQGPVLTVRIGMRGITEAKPHCPICASRKLDAGHKTTNCPPFNGRTVDTSPEQEEPMESPRQTIGEPQPMR